MAVAFSETFSFQAEVVRKDVIVWEKEAIMFGHAHGPYDDRSFLDLLVCQKRKFKVCASSDVMHVISTHDVRTAVGENIPNESDRRCISR